MSKEGKKSTKKKKAPILTQATLTADSKGKPSVRKASKEK
jgi:hypothetical protein